MNTETKDLRNLCIEYYDGCNNCPSYKLLEDSYGSKWRRGINKADGDKKRQFWKGRLSCIKELERLEQEKQLSRLVLIELIEKFKKETIPLVDIVHKKQPNWKALWHMSGNKLN